jgi:hypothetical protein
LSNRAAKYQARRTTKQEEVERMKTRIAYGYHKKSGKTLYLGDTIEAALKANMTYKEYEKQLIEANPQLEITIKIERK